MAGQKLLACIYLHCTNFWNLFRIEAWISLQRNQNGNK